MRAFHRPRPRLPSSVPTGLLLGVTAWVLAGSLAAQRTEIDRAVSTAKAALRAGDLTRAMEVLRTADTSLADPRVHRLLAIAHQRRGLERYAKKKFDLAYRDYFAADRFAPDRESTLQSLGWICFHLDRKRDAESYMKRTLKQNADNVEALTLLAHLARQKDQLELASAYMKRLARLAPERRDLQVRAAQFAAESEVEKGFVTRLSGSFRIQHQAGDATVGLALPSISRYLNEAHRDLRSALGTVPTRKSTIVIYSETQFRKVRSVHDWARAYFDGKVRVALRGWPLNRAQLRADLRHELTHAYVTALHPKTPTWLHEGIAQVIEKRDAGIAVSRFRAGIYKPLPVAVLQQDFTKIKDVDQVTVAYAECLVLVDHLYRVGGWRRLRQLLEEAGRLRSADQALKVVYRKGMADLLQHALR